MLRLAKVLWACLAFSIAVAHAADDPAADPASDPEIRRTLNEISHMSAWYHPDIYGMSMGIKYYVQRRYTGALRMFEIGALYADKFSQLSIGLMYLNGEGVAKDPVTAYAWMDLAAERDYPQFVATRDGLKTTLTDEQLAKARVLRADLEKRYGDAIAKPRMAVQLRLGQMQFTGAFAGDLEGKHPLDFWKPDEYFAARDRRWKATVTVGAPVDEGPAHQPPGGEKAAGSDDASSTKH